MTAILAVKTDQGVWLGTDSYAGGYYEKNYNINKICRGYYISAGVSGKTMTIKVMQDFINKNNDKELNLERLSLARKYLAEMGENDYQIILTDGYNIYRIDENKIEDCYESGLLFAGSGGDAALNAYRIHTQYNGEREIKDNILYAIKYAIQYCNGCGGEPNLHFTRRNL